MKQQLITLLILSSVFGSPVSLASVIVPMPSSVLLGHEKCGEWVINMTYTATSVDDSVLEQLAHFNGVGVFEQTKYMYDKRTQYSAPRSLYFLPPREKLEIINKEIYGVTNPVLGQQVTTTYMRGKSMCPYDDGHIPCVGTMLSKSSGHSNFTGKGEWPPTFPAGTCVYIPRQPGSCKFDVPAATIDYGVISPGIHDRAVNVPIHCTEPTTLQIHLLDPSDGTSDTVESEHMKSVIRINDQPLPYTSRIDGSTTVSVSASSTIDDQASGHVANAATLRISIE